MRFSLLSAPGDVPAAKARPRPTASIKGNRVRIKEL
jgi:hypothetical protein